MNPAMARLRIRTRASRLQWLAIALLPAIAVSDWTVHAVSLACSVLAAGVVAVVARIALRRLPLQARWPLSIMISVALMSCLALMIDALWHPLFSALNVFVLLFAANLAVHSESVDGTASVAQGVRASVSIVFAFLVLGVTREAVGHGSFLHDAAQTLATSMGVLEVQFFRTDRGFLLAMLPPGAFIATGFLLAARNWWDQRRHESKES
jgi:Na+-translocating ferredoxin:NAD+ oxidoreductase subunit E